MIVLKDVSKSFGNTKALQNISCVIKKGDIIGFLGPNGAGKTTTMRLLLGYIKPDSGLVSVLHQNPTVNPLSILKKTGYLPENNPLYADMKVSEYLSFIADVKGAASYEHMYKLVDLEEKRNAKIETLSRGFRQRVGLAAALIGDPELLILDEPTSGLDPIEQTKIRHLITKMAKDRIVIFSTHMLSEVEDIATRLMIVHKGKKVFDGKKPAGKGSVDKLFKKLIKDKA